MPEHFAPCPYCYFTFFHTGYIFRSLEQDLFRAVAGKFRRSLKLKILGKTAGDSPHGEGKSRTETFLTNSVKKYSNHCFLCSSATSVTKFRGSLVYPSGSSRHSTINPLGHFVKLLCMHKNVLPCLLISLPMLSEC